MDSETITESQASSTAGSEDPGFSERRSRPSEQPSPRGRHHTGRALCRPRASRAPSRESAPHDPHSAGRAAASRCPPAGSGRPSPRERAGPWEGRPGRPPELKAACVSPEPPFPKPTPEPLPWPPRWPQQPLRLRLSARNVAVRPECTGCEGPPLTASRNRSLSQTHRTGRGCCRGRHPAQRVPHSSHLQGKATKGLIPAVLPGCGLGPS